jgi:hypothetical protein
MITESLGKELERKREETSKFYKELMDSDYEYMKQQANIFVKEHPNLSLEDMFLQGWLKSIEQPLSRSIHLISMYTQDYIPGKYQADLKLVTSKILGIFRNKLHNLTFNDNESKSN